jgi:hypothetical protein
VPRPRNRPYGCVPSWPRSRPAWRNCATPAERVRSWSV